MGSLEQMQSRNQYEFVIYQCTTLTQLKWAEGTLEQATTEYIELVQEWCESFRIETQIAILQNVDQITRQVEQGIVYLRATDCPVSTVVSSRGTENIVAISAVYTPPEYRNNGYATAQTAAVTQKILNSGTKRAVLYTDLDNPTSNSIYQQIGYKPFSDSTVWLFSPAL